MKVIQKFPKFLHYLIFGIKFHNTYQLISFAKSKET